jgi:hypothetical protein
MWFPVIWIVVITVGISAHVDVVPLNSLCPLADDIYELRHNIKDRRVDIVYHHERRCSKPSLILRLSGPSLYKLDYIGWFNSTQVYQYPPLLDPGKYFLETVVVFCSEYQPERQETQCQENFHLGRNVVNLPYNFSVSVEVVVKRRARWTLGSGEPALLPTRHQRLPSEPHPGLSCAERYHEQYCVGEEAELMQHQAYNWTDGADWMPLAEAVRTRLTKQANSSNESEHSLYVCFVGDSHSVKMTTSLGIITEVMNVSWITGKTLHEPFAVLVDPSSIDQAPCSVAVLSFAIWPLVHSPYPHTPKVHKEQIERLLGLVTAYGGPTKIFFRSENINGLGVFADQCPAGRDRRSPPAFDAVNNATREVCAQWRVPFIDLDPIIYPMWDSALDFCHPMRSVFNAEAEFILYSVFRHVIKHKLVLTTYPTALGHGPHPTKTGPAVVTQMVKLLCSTRAPGTCP